MDTQRPVASEPDEIAYYNQGVDFQSLQRYAEALASYDEAIRRKPDYAKAHHNRAVILQEMQRYDEALKSYDDAIAAKPDYATAHYNRGLVLQKMRRPDEALASYDRAIALKADFAESYNARGVILQDMQRYTEALASCDRAVALKADYAPAHNNRGAILEKLQRYDDALASCDQAIALHPEDAEAHNNRGIILREMKRYDEALASCDKAIAIQPDFAEAHNNRGVTLQEIHRCDEALASYDRAIALAPDFAEAHYNRGLALQELRRYVEALASCDAAIVLKPDYAQAYNLRGLILVNQGDMRQAEMMFRKALALKPDFPNPWFSLTNIRKYRVADDADIIQVRRLLDNPEISLRGKEYLYFALGKMYDDCGRYDEAFDAYREANRIRNAEVAYNPKKVSEWTDRLIQVFSKDFLARPFAFASSSRLPLFIVGMPRSGTTLMASILSNHPSIATAGELTTLTECTLQLPEWLGNSLPYPQAATHITPDVAARLIHDYETRLRRDAAPDKLRVIDKYPLNFQHLGLIAMLFPQARIIHCMRHPLDTALSNYFQRFPLEYDYACDLENIAHFYREYEKLMAHWRNSLPQPMIEIHYEEMISGTEKMARRILTALEMEWDERCLFPHTNPCAVETASNWQVRQPIYRQSVERWRHYEKYLNSIQELLHIGHF